MKGAVALCLFFAFCFLAGGALRLPLGDQPMGWGVSWGWRPLRHRAGRPGAASQQPQRELPRFEFAEEVKESGSNSPLFSPTQKNIF